MTQWLKQSTAVKVRIGPFVDVGDGFTPETGVALSTADEAELLKHNGAATVDISAATWAAITGPDGWYDLSLTSSHTDTVGLLDIVVNDDSVCLPVFARFMVVPANVYDSMIAGSDNLQTDAIQISGDATAADNAELMFDGTGYAGGTTLLQVDAKAISTSTDAADKLEAATETMVIGTVDNSAHTPTTTEFEADDITEATADHFNGRIIVFTSGVLLRQITTITDYALSGSNGHFTVATMTEAPGNNDTFVII